MSIGERCKNLVGGAVRNRHAVLLACIVWASLVLRVYVSKRCSLWLDEVWTRHDAGAPWPMLLAGPSREHPPLMFVLVRLTTDVFGTSDLALRAVSLFFGCALLVAVYLLCLELELSRTEGLLAVVACALAPFFMRHATEARLYAMLAVFTTLELVFVLRLLRDPADFRALVGTALSAAAASATHYFGLAYACCLLGALAFGTFPAWRNAPHPLRIPRRTLAVLGALGLVLAAVALRAAWLFVFYRTHKIGPHARDLEGTILSDFAFFSTRVHTVRAQAFVAAAGLVFVGWRLRGIARVLPFAMGLPPLGLALLISSGHAVSPRYLAPSWVLYQVGSAAAFIAVLRVLRGGTELWLRLVRTAVAAPVVLVPLALRLAEYPHGFGAGRTDYAGLQRYFAGDRARGTALVVYPHFPGAFIVNGGYPVNAPLVSLDEFEPVPGVKRYLVAEFERTSQVPELEALAEKHFHLTRREWRSLPIVRLPHSAFQPPVRARLVHVHATTPQDEPSSSAD